MGFFEYMDSNIGDRIYLITNVKDLKEGYYKIISKEYNKIFGYMILVEGADDYLDCNFFHTLKHMRKLKLRKLLNE